MTSQGGGWTCQCGASVPFGVTHSCGAPGVTLGPGESALARIDVNMLVLDAYARGRAEGAAAERARIVAWLRAHDGAIRHLTVDAACHGGDWSLKFIADEIERGAAGEGGGLP